MMYYYSDIRRIFCQTEDHVDTNFCILLYLCTIIILSHQWSNFLYRVKYFSCHVLDSKNILYFWLKNNLLIDRRSYYIMLTSRFLCTMYILYNVRVRIFISCQFFQTTVRSIHWNKCNHAWIIPIYPVWTISHENLVPQGDDSINSIYTE